jgi:arginyl-tRNA synthetase
LVEKLPEIILSHESERALALSLLRFPESLAQAADLKPNLLTNYLFELANAYSSFFRDCPVLKAETEELRWSRLALCELTARTLKAGLACLGIRTAERM